MGVPRAVIKSRVLGPPNSEVVLEFQRDRRVFKVTLLRQAQLLSSNVRNSVSGSTTRQAENGDREQCLERSAWSQAAERFRGSLSSDKEQGKALCPRNGLTARPRCRSVSLACPQPVSCLSLSLPSASPVLSVSRFLSRPLPRSLSEDMDPENVPQPSSLTPCTPFHTR